MPRVRRLATSALTRMTLLDPFPQPTVVRTQYPVVLMHGFGLLAGLRRYGHLHEEALFLRSHGVLAYAPNVSPYQTIAVRAEQWLARLRHVLLETGAQKVNLVAHSMGGLDARFLIHTYGFHQHVASLTTISTPHHGSSVAMLALEQPERLRDALADFINWMGASTKLHPTADVLAALLELTPEHVCDVFNRAVPNHPDVVYRSFAGRAGRGTTHSINPLLRLQNHVLYGREGVNDGLVSTESAAWGTFCGLLDADHAEQVGLRLMPGEGFDSNRFFLAQAAELRDAGL